ncbi:MAG: 30S ribosome-binding factor RbfA [Christensenellaceae bacterium]|nr:30S ribosome-binding factor RbfA [Christensenellaceae bacterium]
MAKNRSVRLEGEFKRALAEVFLREVKDPCISPMLGVTRVEITPDLKYAKVYVSVYDSPEKVTSTMEALARAEGFIRAKLNEKIKVRRIPNLTFVHDTSIEYSVKIAKIIDEVTKKDQENQESEEE